MFWYNVAIVFNAKVPMRKWRFPTRIWYLRHISKNNVVEMIKKAI